MKERRIVSKFVPLQKKTTNLSMKSIPKQFIICSAAMTAALCVLLLMFPGADFSDSSLNIFSPVPFPYGFTGVSVHRTPEACVPLV